MSGDEKDKWSKIRDRVPKISLELK